MKVWKCRVKNSVGDSCRGVTVVEVEISGIGSRKETLEEELLRAACGRDSDGVDICVISCVVRVDVSPLLSHNVVQSPVKHARSLD